MSVGKVSVITPSIRKELLPMVHACLKRQTFDEFEWIVVSPFEYEDADIWIPEPKRNEGDFYGLNKAWNAAISASHGSLIVSIVDGLWFEPNVLSRLWNHYQTNPYSCVGLIGNQFNRIENGKPEHLTWVDPRTQPSTFYEVEPVFFELCIASIPKKALTDVGGFDEEWDKYAAISEKELCKRIAKLGYKFYIDQSTEYRAYTHDRVNGKEKWDERYKAGEQYWFQCLKEIDEGSRLKLDFLK